MDCGFETIGNATLICHDKGPVLVADPWLRGTAYFGSWNLGYEIPEEQLESINNTEFVWLSHGHPDHLSMRSLRPLKGKKILLPDHVGGRIAGELTNLGFDVTVLQDRVWTQLSPRIRVLTLADYNQDGILLADINGTLVMDLNDASPRGWAGFIKKISRSYKESFVLQLCGFGDPDIAYFDEGGEMIEPRAALRLPVGQTMSRVADFYGAKYILPFSSLHKYQRADSVWANQYLTSLTAYSDGFNSKHAELLPPFIQYNSVTHNAEHINPREIPDEVLPPEKFGDDWNETLEGDEFSTLQGYIKAISHLGKVLDFVNFRVGGQDNVIQLDNKGFKKGLVFEVPRHSLMRAVQYEIFEDLLISNFMKTTMVGKWPASKLYPDFTPYVAKYADNGLAKSQEELDAYFRQYRKRATMEFIRHRMQQGVAQVVRNNLDSRNPLYQFAQRIWWLGMGRFMN